MKQSNKGLPAQSVVEYVLILAAFLVVFIAGAAAVRANENGYFASLGPKLAPEPTVFATLPVPSPTSTPPPGPTATPAPSTPTPTPTPISGNPVDISVSCAPSSGTLPSGTGSFTTTCTVTVSSSTGSSPSGSVAWSVNPTTSGSFSAGTCALTSNPPHSASCTVSYQTTTAGTQTITGFYSGDSHYTNGGASTTITVKRATAMSVSCNPTDPVVGQVPAVLCTATLTDTSAGTPIAPSAAPTWSTSPTSAGTFATTSCSTSGAIETCSVRYTPTAAGSQTITADYSGDSTHVASPPASASLNVAKADTSISAQGVGITYGTTSITLVANVSPNVPSQAVVNEGSITFSVGSPTIGTSITCSLSSPQNCPVSFSGSQATVSTTYSLPATLAPGSYPITIMYSGGPDFQPSASSNTYYVAVGQISTTVIANAVTVPYNVSTVQLTGTANVAYPATGVVTQGTLSFTVTTAGGAVICSTAAVSVSPVDGTASGACSIPASTPLGAYTVTPTYTGQGNFSSCSASGGCVTNGTLTITTRSTSTDVACTPATLNAGTSTVCTVTVADNEAGTPVALTGTVSLADSAGGTVPSTLGCTLTASGGGPYGSCQVSFAATEGGSQTVTASYAGDTLHKASVSASPQTLVVYRTTGTSVSCSPDPITVGVSSTCSTSVRDTSPGTIHEPAGTITWSVSPSTSGSFDSGGSCALNPTGSCSVSFTPSAAGSLTLTANFHGTGMFLDSSGSTALTAKLRTTSTSVACTDGQVSVGTADACTVTVTDIDAGTKTTPTGTVTWSDSSTATLSPSSCTLTPVGGTADKARCTINDTPGDPGMHTLTATYAGDSAVHAGSSGTTSFRAVLGTTTSVTCDYTSDEIGAPSTCTATVTGGSAGMPRPSGTVTWSTNNGGPVSQFSSLTCSLDGPGPCTVTYTPSAFGTGNANTLTAVYGGDTSYLPSQGSLTLTITKRPVSVSVVCSPSPVGDTRTSTCSVTVNDTGRGTTTSPTGQVTWSVAAGGGTLPASCTLAAGATCNVTYTAPATVGDYTLNAQYSGDTLHVSKLQTYDISVRRNSSASVTCSPTSMTVGTSTTCTVKVTDTDSGNGTPSGPASWTASGTGTFSPDSAVCSLVGNGNSASCSITYTPGSVGSPSITATYAGDSSHAGSAASATLSVTRAAPTVTWANPANISYGTPLSGTQLNATASVPGTFAYTPPAGTVLNVGTGQALSVLFTPTDSADYTTASASVVINVLRSSQTITFGAIADHTYGNGPFAISATASSGLPVTFTASGNCTVSGSTVTITGAGTCTITATQAGNSSYTAAQLVSQTFTSARAAATITLNAATLNQTYDGTARMVTASTSPASLSYSVTYNGSSTAPTTVGTYAVVATITAPNYTGSTSGSLVIARATPAMTWATPADITYGTALSVTQLNASANAAGTFTYTPTTGTLLNAGNGQTLSATFTPTDTVDYTSATLTVKINVLKATPTITWANPADITYGTLLSSTQLNATSSVPGAMAYTPAIDSMLGAGSGRTLSVTFTPTDSANYNTATATVSINVSKASAAVTLSSLNQVYDGTARSVVVSVTPNVATSVSYAGTGSTVYGPSATPPTKAGTYSVLATVTDPNYQGTASGTLVVAKATPTITWANPANITYGTALGATQLNASASVPGSFTYSPPAGTALSAGNAQTLSVTFTPTDATDYTTATASVSINIVKATASVTISNTSQTYTGAGRAVTVTTNPAGLLTNVTYTGTGSTSYGPSSTPPTGAGTYSVTAGVSDSNYQGSASATLTVAMATPVVTWSNPATITQGTPLSNTQLNATASVPGTFAYTPPAGTVLSKGQNQTLSVTFTPTDSSNYATATATVKIDVK